MRTNLPVSNHEYVMQAGRPIVSKTDLKGRITYVNPYFVEVSGFAEDELIGAPHNLVRHPDMPPEAFADLWRCLKAGELWTAPVKNRRKNGDYYWVIANVTPVIENGQVTGYMSVRTKPSRAQIDAAEAAYAEMRRGSASRLEVAHGCIRQRGAMARLLRALQLPIRQRIALGASMSLASLGAIVGAKLIAPDTMPTWIAAVAVLAMLAIGSCWSYLHRYVLAPLEQARSLATSLAAGDLTSGVQTERRDDMGRLLLALQQMNVNLAAVISDIRRNADAMNTATGEIAAGNMDLSSRTESQASSLEETASSMEQFAATVRQNAENAQQAEHLAASASMIAQQGGEVVLNVGKTMDAISSSSRKVADILGLIDSIAFQTNILALNAAVEAARAGEHGRGFAVVATEVRNLAQRSAAAAKEIKHLIQDSVASVDAGNRLVDDAKHTMEDIVDAVARVSGIVNEIANASREQAIGIQQVNQAVSQMDQVTQQNAALVEQAAAASTSLHEQAAQLVHAVSVFQLDAANADRPGLQLVPAVAKRAPPPRLAA